MTGDVFLDPGTAGTTAAILVARTGPKTRLALDEYYHIGDEMGRLTDDEHLRRLRTRKGWAIQRLIVDPESANMRAQAGQMGFDVTQARNEFNEGVQITNHALYSGAMTIHERCQNLIDESASYIWNITEERPMAGVPDHLMDCLRYACRKYWPAYRAMLLAR